MNDGEKISELLGDLKKVSAPKNFQYQVNARIAKGRPSSAVRGYFTFLKYAVPFAAMLLIVGIVAIQTNLMYDADAVPAVATDRSEQPQIKTATNSVNTIVSTAETSKPVVETAVTENILPAKPTVNRDKVVDRPKPSEGGSYDATLRAPRETILPPGIQNEPQATPVVIDPSIGEPIAVSDVLSQLGINAKQINGVWSAADVNKGSLAERSGVKKGDVVKAIDEHQLKNIKEFSGSISGKRVTVVRDGNVIVLELR
jgi:hypothetical protein